MDKKLRLLKIILWTYIILCFIIAGLNYSYVKTAPESTSRIIEWIWHFYENWVKNFLLCCSFLTISIFKKSIDKYREKELIGFIIAALVIQYHFPLCC